ncbi:hypothetical protein PJM26_31140, partial [Mycobacterium kansasii]
RGSPGIHSADIEKREDALQPNNLPTGTEAANLDLADDRDEGKTAAMPQLINALDAAISSGNYNLIDKLLRFFLVKL